jgi:hypothetical protein
MGKKALAQINYYKAMKKKMATEPTIYVFKLSKATEFPHGIADVLRWMERKGTNEGYYHFRSHTPRNVHAGSIVLFEIEGRIIGQGIVKEGLKRTPKERIHIGDYDYPYFITFEPSMFETFKEYPFEADVSYATGKKFGRLFKELDWEDYLIVLSMAKKHVNKADVEERFKEETRDLTKYDIRNLIANRDKINGYHRGTFLSKNKRHYRDPILALYLKDWYEDSCQIKGCGSDNSVQHGYFTDTHHIIPLGKRGRDISSNILVLCPNHHRLFHRSSVKLVGRRDGEILLEIADEEFVAVSSVT